MTDEERLQKRQLNNARSKAVRDAWSRETDLVKNGQATVDWTHDQQRELLTEGRVSGYEGHHMKSVSRYPEFADCVDNIQFLNHDEHKSAHNCSELSEMKGYRSPTNGYYDVKTNTMHSFGDKPPKAPEVIQLSHACVLEHNENAESVSELNHSDKEKNVDSKAIETDKAKKLMLGRG